MSFDTARKSAENILNNWGRLPIAFDGVPFDSKDQTDWVRIMVLDGDSFETAIGSNCVKHTGLVLIQIFSAQFEGSAIVRRCADEISNLYKGVVDDGVVYRAAVGTRVGHDGDFYQFNVSIPWELNVT